MDSLKNRAQKNANNSSLQEELSNAEAAFREQQLKVGALVEKLEQRLADGVGAIKKLTGANKDYFQKSQKAMQTFYDAL